MKRKRILILLLVVAVLVLIGHSTYAYYISRTQVTVSATASNIKCDAEIISIQEKSKLGYSQFKVVVKNYDSSDNITKRAFHYTLTIENNNGSNGVFGYNNSFNNSLTFTGDVTSTATKSDVGYVIQVKANSGLSENVDYKVKLNCIQDN